MLLLLLTSRADLALASGPEPDDGEIVASVGDMVHFELTSDLPGKRVPAVLVKDPPASQPVIRVTLASDAFGNRTLRIANSYRNAISFDFRICENAPNPVCRVFVESYVIEGGGEMSQLLQDHAGRIIFFNFARLKESGESLLAAQR